MQSLALSLALLLFSASSLAAPSHDLSITLNIDTSLVPSDVPFFTEDGAVELVELTEEAFGADVQAYLHTHNTFRARHGARALQWDNVLQSKAQSWANRCQFHHSGGTLGPYGENLAAGTGGAYDVAAAVKSWTDEIAHYDPNHPQPSHFTQVVWKGSEKLGCAVAECSGIFPEKYGKAHYHVCEYFPAGNVIGRFPANVQK